MKKVFVLVFTAMVFVTSYAQVQTVLLFTEDFDHGTVSVQFGSDSGAPSSNFGNNDWIINNSYDGQSIYPNTPSQDSTNGGLIINNAPFSRYLHIRNKDAQSSGGVSNDHWDSRFASDRFCYLGGSFCTLGFTNVEFTFDWICEGNNSSYGEVYFRSGTGPWIQIGKPRYYNTGKWTYESITDPRMINQANIQIGFRWVNPLLNNAPNTIAFGIDDIFAVGTYNSADNANSVEITATALTSQICQGKPIPFQIGLSAPLCDGLYQIQMSDAFGSFRNPYNLGILQAGPTFLGGSYNSLPTDGNLSGSCFQIRIVRTEPAPMLVSDTSFCISIVECPNTIYNINAPVMRDADTTCILSEIDVKFNSTGVFKEGNVYYAELSDQFGNFSDSTLLGTLPVRDSFPATPGNISGLIPASIPPGCGYYIRVRSTNPPTVGARIGPYCLVQCDILTNNIQDLHFCVASGPHPTCDSISIGKNQWNGDAAYDTCNNWRIELRSMTDFSLVNSGGLGIYHDNVGGNFQLCMPANVALLPVAPGAYYMRIVSANNTCSNQPWNQTGTVIRITIGAPNALPSVITLSDNEICAGTSVSFFVSPFRHPPSDYVWTSSLLNAGVPFIWPFSGFSVGTLPFTPHGTYVTTVREINYGCFGPVSDPVYLTIKGNPPVEITGPTSVCQGDTVHFNVSFLDQTYYLWTSTPGADVLEGSNVQTSVVFDSLGTFSVSNYSLNTCGSDSVSIEVTVSPPTFSLNAGPDTTVCIGDTVHIDANASDLVKVFQVMDTGIAGKPGGMFNLKAHSDLTIDSFAVKLKTRPQSMRAEIYGKPGSYLTYEHNASAWTLLAKNYNNSTSPVGQFTVISAPVSKFLAAGDSFAFYITTLNTPVLNIAYGTGNDVQGKLFKGDGDLDFIQGTVLDYPFTNSLPVTGYVLDVKIYYSTQSNFQFTWSSGDTTSGFMTAPSQDIDYSVLVGTNGNCSRRDTVHLRVKPLPTVNAGPDTSVCPNQPYTMQGNSTGHITVWQPAIGLSSISDPHAIFNHDDNVSFVLTTIDTNTHCSHKDAVDILVPLKLSVGPDTTICNGAEVFLHATSTGERVVWRPSLGLSDSTALEPLFSSLNAPGGEFMITAMDPNGCTLTSITRVDIENCSGVIVGPSAFTPTSPGNQFPPNDHFILWGKNIQEYEVRIYNRWGELVYDSGKMGALDNNYSPPLWDGRFKGKLQDLGTFVYYINAADMQGNKVEKKGNLTLLR